MKLILFATFREAKTTLEKLKANPLSPSLFASDSFLIAISGMGSLSAYLATLRFGSDVDEILNVGFAGSLSRDLPLGSFHAITSATKTDFNPISLPQKGLRLFSSDRPLHSDEARNRLSSSFDLVDMEGYGVALAAQKLKRSCQLYKWVSDLVSTKREKSLLNRKEDLSLMLWEELRKILERKSH